MPPDVKMKKNITLNYYMVNGLEPLLKHVKCEERRSCCELREQKYPGEC